MNRNGVHQFRPKWSRALCLIARLAFALERCVPEDLRAWSNFVDVLGPKFSHGTRIEPSEWAWMLTACLVQWPVAVENVQASLVNARASGTSSWKASAALANAVSGCIEQAMDMTVYQNTYHQGRVCGKFGLPWFAKKVGLLIASGQSEEDDEGNPNKLLKMGSRRCKLKRKTNPQCLDLDIEPKAYVLTKDVAQAQLHFQHMLDTCPVDLSWPTDAQQMVAFVDALVAGVAKSVQLEIGAYSTTCCVRNILWSLENCRGPRLLNAVTLGQMSAWCHNAGSFDDELLERSGLYVRNRFGISPLMLPYWLCLASELSEDEVLRLEEASDIEILGLASVRRTSKHPDVPVVPSLQSIARDLLAKKR